MRGEPTTFGSHRLSVTVLQEGVASWRWPARTPANGA